MKIKISFLLWSIWISFFITSCTKYQVYWTDLREKTFDNDISIVFRDGNSIKEKEINFTCGKTKGIKIPSNFIADLIQTPINIGVEYLIDYENKKIEFFVMDWNIHSDNDVYSFPLKESVLFYQIRIKQPEFERFMILSSRENELNIKNATELDVQINNQIDYLKEIHNKSVYYYSSLKKENMVYYQDLIPYYFVHSVISDKAFWISPEHSGVIDAYLDFKDLPF